MTMYAKWFFGFTPERLPVITFSQRGSRDSLLKSAQPGEVIVYVATKGQETDEEERGRVLGAAEVGRKAVPWPGVNRAASRAVLHRAIVDS